MDLQLKDKTALVTGSTVGIGFAIAELLAKEGATVIINGRSQERVEHAIEEIQKKIPKAILKATVADLGTKEGCDNVIKQFPTVDILVNNVGIYDAKQFTDISDEEWIHFFQVNVMSGVRLSRHYLTPMLKKNWGRIIFISSESGLQTPKEMVHYGMTKSAQISIARGIAEATEGTQVTVNSVLPGPTMSEGVEEFIKNIGKERNLTYKEIEDDFFKTIRPTSLIKRFESSDEIANMVAFLCSPLASATTGAAIRVDGGVIRTMA
ncbi:MAG: SDR family oxidoreductase [Legionella sp.]|uniref:SDR family NAD(P)-dependent oxidoreductase n=1 Tax=Legionella sp. TaxID=459 RepID=UPI0039E680EE